MFMFQLSPAFVSYVHDFSSFISLLFPLCSAAKFLPMVLSMNHLCADKIIFRRSRSVSIVT